MYLNICPFISSKQQVLKIIHVSVVIVCFQAAFKLIYYINKAVKRNYNIIIMEKV